MTIRYWIRWDGRGKPKPARFAALGMALAAILLFPVSARADDKVSRSASGIAGGAGRAGINDPEGRGVDVALIDSGVSA